MGFSHEVSGGRTASASLTVLVPVFNEQHLVEASLRRLEVLGQSPLLRRIQVIVVDNGSVDQTPQILREFHSSLGPHWGCGKFEWEFMRLDPNRGKGGALLAALDRANGDFTVPHDADLEYHPADLLKMIPLFLEEDADAVFGTRFRGGQVRRLLYLRHALANWVLTSFAALLSNLDISDVETCYKMIRTELFQSIPLETLDFRLDPELAIKLAKRDARIFEVPISYSGRTRQEGKKIGLKDGVLALWCMMDVALSDDVFKKDKFNSHISMRLRRAPRFFRWQAEMVAPYVGQRVLEIGAGIGNLSLELTPRQVYWAADANPLYLHSLQRLASTRPYLHTCAMDIRDPESFPRDQRFDTVVCRNIVEQLDDDAEALRNVHRILTDQGTAIVIVPQGPGLFGHVDRALGHRRRYTREGLAELGRSAGFHVRAILPFNRITTPFWWWDGKVLGRKNVGLGRVTFFNALLPLLRPLDRVLPFPPLSLIGILEKQP